MKTVKKMVALMLALVMLLSVTGCGREATALDQAGKGDAPALSDVAAVEACEAANRLLTGDGISKRGKQVYLRGVPLSVRESELARALPNKEVLRLALKYDVLPTREEAQKRLSGLGAPAGEKNAALDSAMVVAENKVLCELVEQNVFEVWRKKVNPIARIRKQTRTKDDWQAYIAKLDNKNKTELVLQQ